MIKVIVLNFVGFIISHCYAQPDQLSLVANHHHLAFHQPDLGIHHQLTFHQANHPINQFQHNSQPQSITRHNHQSNGLRNGRLLSSASSPKSLIITNRPQEQLNRQPQFNQNQNNFKPINRPPQSRPQILNNDHKRSKQSKQAGHQRNNRGHRHHVQSKINWGRCPMLQPSSEEKMKKAQVISKCLEITPVPDNITRETIELHRELVAACALREEGWFTSALSSDETLIKINVNNTNKTILNNNLTTSSIEANDTLKDTGSKNKNLNNDDQTKEKNNHTETSVTSESLLKPINLNLNGTKVNQTNNEKISSTNSTSKTDKSDNQSEILHETKHSALESDDYVEDDLAGYSAIFTGQLTYNYAKAEREIKAKHFDPEIEEKVIEYHESCKEEAEEKYSNPIQIIGQIELYQQCMDFHISAVCGIEVTY